MPCLCASLASSAATILVVGVALAVGAGSQPAWSQPIPDGVVFDDFAYTSTEWRMAVQRDHADGTPSPDVEGAPGSLYGPNAWWTPGGELHRRAWYRYGWQEEWNSAFGGSLDPSPNGLSFRVPPGLHVGDRCPDPRDPSRPMAPQQIASGFTATRGTWVARLRFSTLAEARDGVHIQAFWLVSHAFGRMRTAEGDLPVWNEVDHEFNNAFRGPDQPYPYDATSVRSGAGRDVGWVGLAAPGHAAGVDGARAGCAVTVRGRTHLEPEAACMARLANPPDRQTPVWATLIMRVSDAGVVFEVTAQDGDASLEMVSARHAPAPVLPLVTLFSQHLNPLGHGWSCEQQVPLAHEAEMEVDWMYYDRDPEASRARVEAGVAAFRARGIPRAVTGPSLELERPVRHYGALAGDWGVGARTTPLELDLDGPSRMAPGEHGQVVARPPLRHGVFRVTWTVTQRVRGGPLETHAVTDASFALPLTFPAGVDLLIVRARLEEVDEAGAPIYTETVQPVEDTHLIYRR